MVRRKTVRIAFAPITAMIVHEEQHLEKEQLLFSMGHGVEAGNIGRGLNWADGIAFAYSFIPLEDPRIIDQYLRGTIHIASVAYTEWPEYVPFVELSSSKVRIPLWKTELPSLLALVQWLKRMKH